MKKNFTLCLVLIFISATCFSQSAIDNQNPLAYNSSSAKLQAFYNLDAGNRQSQSPLQDLEKNKNDITVLPQIADGNQKIVIKNLDEPCNISVVDYTGRIIENFSSKGNYAQISDLVKGNYFVNITGTQSGKFVVRKLSVLN